MARARRASHRHCAALLLHGERQLQRLLLPALDDLLPQLTLMLHALELGLDVLLRDLQQAQDTVVGLLGDHIENVSETLRAPLTPSLIDTEGHVLRALLPTKELDVGLALVDTLGVVEPGAREDADVLGEP